MRAHKGVNIITILPELIQKAHCNSTLAVVAMYYQLSDPTHCFAIGSPAAGERVTSKMAVNDNSDIRA
jgi:hypothetical protein